MKKITHSTIRIGGQRAFTLVELLVGLFLSLFIVGVTITYFVSSAQSFKSQANQGFTQESARFALEFLSQNVRMAGYASDEEVDLTMQHIFGGAFCASSENGSVAGDNDICTRDNLANNSDRFAIDYKVSDSITLCNGETAAPLFGDRDRHIAVVFWTADIDGDGIRSLYCQGVDARSGAPLGNALPMVDGVDRMQVQYGFDSDNDGVPNSYVSYTNLGSANTKSVRAVRVGLLVSAATVAGDRNTEVAAAKTYQLLDGPSETIVDDRVVRQVFSTTIALPNARLNQI